jgi:hypothetical protein
MKRSAVCIDPARAAALVELPAAFHPLLVEKLAREKTRREREEQRALPENEWGPFRTTLGRRELRVQDAILKAADARGHTICHHENSLFGIWLVINGEHVDWELRERYHYYPPRSAELERDPQGRKQKNVAELSGYLILSIKAAYSTEQEVRERHRRLFENRIEEILQKFEAKAAHAAAKKNWWEERDRQRGEREARELRMQTLEERKDERWSGLCRMTAAWKEADDLRAFVGLVAARMKELEKRPVCAELWLEWAHRRIDALDPSRRDAWTVYEAVVRNPLLPVSKTLPGRAISDNATFGEP